MLLCVAKRPNGLTLISFAPFGARSLRPVPVSFLSNTPPLRHGGRGEGPSQQLARCLLVFLKPRSPPSTPMGCQKVNGQWGGG